MDVERGRRGTGGANKRKGVVGIHGERLGEGLALLTGVGKDCGCREPRSKAGESSDARAGKQ